MKTYTLDLTTMRVKLEAWGRERYLISPNASGTVMISLRDAALAVLVNALDWPQARELHQDLALDLMEEHFEFPERLKITRTLEGLKNWAAMTRLRIAKHRQESKDHDRVLRDRVA